MILHLVTDRRRLAPLGDDERARRCIVEQARFAADAGVDVIQLRERDLDAGPLARLLDAVLTAVSGTATRVVVNDRLDVALAGGAHGVHLPAASIPPQAARGLAPEGFLIGRSVHSAEEAVDAAPHVDYVIAGTVWPTSSKPAGSPLLGPSGLKAIAAAVRVPVLAIGGVSVARAGETAACGAGGVAGIGLFMNQASADPGQCRAIPLTGVARAMRSAFDTPSRPS